MRDFYSFELKIVKDNNNNNNNTCKRSDDQAKYLDLTFIIGNKNRLYNKLYGIHDDFSFHIVSFPFLSSDAPPGPLYGVYILQLIMYARSFTNYEDFGYCGKLLVNFGYCGKLPFSGK